MNSRLGPVEIECDAPPYAVVQACAYLGFHRPLDVRWRHARELTAGGRPGDQGLGRRLWKALLGRGRGRRLACACGQGLSPLGRYEFTLRWGTEVEYLLGQCPRCATMFWEDA
jgi:hypothetical protein